MWKKEKEIDKVKSIIQYQDEFKDKTVLLIGSNGFLGRWFYDFFSSIDCQLICLDNDIAPNDTSTLYINKDICEDITKVLPRNRYNIDYVINCAGIASPEKYLKLPVETLDVSYIGTRNVLELCKIHDVKSVLFFSSSEIYGTPDPDFIPTSEDYVGKIPTNSNRSCYDVGKLVLETLVNVYVKEHNVNAKIVRPFNLYGPYMGTKDNRVLSNFMNNYLLKKPLDIYGSGLQTRTYCYAGDGIAMMLKILIGGNTGETYNVGKLSPEINVMQLADLFYESLGGVKNVKKIPYPEGYPSDEPSRRCPNISKVKKELGIEAETEFANGLKIMKSYFEHSNK